ncbi:MAG TPA: ABC transporter substrate-binding protein [Alphaproteobacteria bacterium]|nr:ABC transporter substrate-binding protein [Alphaproteobacteria bacterium]
MICRGAHRLWSSLCIAMILMWTSYPVAGAEKVIKYGIATPLSGPAAPWGIPHVRAAEMVFEEVNNNGGIEIGGQRYKLEIVSYDHKYIIAEGVATVNRLLYRDEVQYVSVLGGAVVKAVEDIIREGKVLCLTLAYAEGLVSPKNPLQFSVFPMPPETTAGWIWVKEQYPQVKRVASLTPNDDTGWWSIKISNNVAQQQGFEVVAKEFFERGVTDFAPTLLRMLAAKPDIIDLTATPAGSTGLIVKQARELGYKGRFIHLGQQNMSVVAGIAGKEAVEGFIVHGFVEEPLPDKVRSWIARYEKKYGPPFDPTTIDFSFGPMAFVAGLKAANSTDPAKIADALRKAEFEVLWGKARFGGKDYYGIGNQILYPMPLAEMRHGVAVQVTLMQAPHKQ